VVWDYPAHPSTDRDTLREYLIRNYRPGTQYTVQNHVAHEDNGIAISMVSWSATGVNDEDEDFTIQGNSKDILRKQPDGRWLFVFDNPWGVDIESHIKVLLKCALVKGNRNSMTQRDVVPNSQNGEPQAETTYASSH
jgi:hypothetical protein